MSQGIFYQPEIIRFNLAKTVIPTCILFPLIYGVFMALLPIVLMWVQHFYLPVTFEMFRSLFQTSVHYSLLQLPDYLEDCLFYAIVKNPFAEKYLLKERQIQY